MIARAKHNLNKQSSFFYWHNKKWRGPESFARRIIMRYKVATLKMRWATREAKKGLK